MFTGRVLGWLGLLSRFLACVPSSFVGATMVKNVAVLILVGAVAACGASDEPATTDVYAARGGLQCTGSGVTLAQQRAKLEGVGVVVVSASCGSDGVSRVAQCGTPNGDIGWFTIPSTQIGLASSSGFLPLSGLPAATKTVCP